ncbi:podocalyxin isoform X2 [Corvus kubaryi]|uniref:podocalyxin isoform X2 n=1 Tax=Corvus kubaryi TaxID=68294 RepID=UPI001C058639|nr:podocalyxin isoform X2 [Corvus kubaryi]
MRAAGLLPLLPLLLLGVRSQDDSGLGQSITTTTITGTTPANTTGMSPTTSALSPTKQPQTTTTTTTDKGPTQIAATTTAQSTATNTTNAGTSSPPAAMSPTAVRGTAPTASGTTLANTTTTTSAPTSGQDSSSHNATNPTAAPAASATTSQQPSNTTASSGILGTTTTAKTVLAGAISPPGAVGTATASSPSTQPQGKQPLDHSSNTTVSTTVPRTDPSQSSKDCAVSPSSCATKQPPSSSSSPVQGLIPSTSPGSTGTSVIPLITSPSLSTTPTSQAGSKDTVREAATTTAPGADQSTHDAGSASAKPTSASQSPASAQTSAPAPREQTDSCSPGHQHPNISSSNKLVCKDRVQHTGPTIYLKEPRTCAEWEAASNDTTFFESFCSTAQHTFDTSRDRCTVTLTACEPQSHCWAVCVVLHFRLDSEEVFKGLKEKKEKLEELGIVNITSDKMVEDMTINDEFSTPLIITIITLAGSLLLIAAIYGCHQRFSQKKDQNIHPDVPGFDDGHVALIFNRLTEEMQTMENGYHDNPTLEVMETSSEMQEKKVNLNGELGDSWIVPLDTLMKEDLEEEEDTHL